MYAGDVFHIDKATIRALAAASKVNIDYAHIKPTLDALSASSGVTIDLARIKPTLDAVSAASKVNADFASSKPTFDVLSAASKQIDHASIRAAVQAIATSALIDDASIRAAADAMPASMPLGTVTPAQSVVIVSDILDSSVSAGGDVGRSDLIEDEDTDTARMSDLSNLELVFIIGAAEWIRQTAITQYGVADDGAALVWVVATYMLAQMWTLMKDTPRL